VADTPDRHRRPKLFVEAFVGERLRLFSLVLAVGAVGGVVGAAYVGMLKLLEKGLWPTHWSNGAHLGVLVGIGLAVGLLTRVLGTPGDVELLVNNIHVLGGAEDLRDLKSLIPVSLLCISSGGGMGPEAPLVQTTGGLGSWLAARWRLSTVDTRILTITGMAAGFTVLFGAPLGSAIFALEILHRRGLEYYEALLPAVLGSLSGYVVNAIVSHAGITSVWHFPEIGTLHQVDLIWGLACGVAGAVVAVAFTYLTRSLQWGFRHLHPTARPILGGLALGLLAFWSPYALTFGEAQINTLVVSKAATATFGTAVLAKLCGTTVTNSSGWRGGFIIPLFFIGVSLGRFGHALFPHSNEVVLMAALMAACNCGVTKTPLGSTLVVAEMAGLRLLPPVLIASVVALLLTSEVGLIHSQRDREGAFGSARAPRAEEHLEGGGPANPTHSD
jgi:H+/Cl- antiporter ClcA